MLISKTTKKIVENYVSNLDLYIHKRHIFSVDDIYTLISDLIQSVTDLPSKFAYPPRLPELKDSNSTQMQKGTVKISPINLTKAMVKTKNIL